MDLPRHLITQIVTGGDLSQALDAGVTSEWLADPKALQVWQFLTEFQIRHGKAPTTEALKAEFPTYKLAKQPEPLDYVLDKLREQRKMSILEAALGRATQRFTTGDPEATARELAAALAELEAEVPSTVDVDITTTALKRAAAYRERAGQELRMHGIPTGFDAVDQLTGGWRPGWLVALVGPPKAGKSTYLLLSSLAAWSAPKRPMFVTFEMTAREMEERLDALESKVSPNGLRDGTLTKADLDRVEKRLRSMELRPSYWLTEDASSASTVSQIVAKAQRLKPDILFIDGVYLMSDDHGEKPGDWKAIANITRGLKRAAKSLGIPIIISTQVRLSKIHGGEITAASIGYGPSFAEDADLIIAAQPTSDHDITKMKSLVGRTVAPFEFWIRRDWDHGTMTELAYDPFGDTDDLGDDDDDVDMF
ncbi:hypothetical protein FDA94_29120 [Herbidospora galbida]|uniref:SF4 helicase domain-containing protein n=1 Tax=Herbidospora galbida TaxID=2575442 RepID=A0A4U3MAH3_9ACTN|nr:DnaB-like helicase C-terminal domain-containing protein [Herbidospora galbida]TKK84677.1 hypothetical protein FDA94_29120 [Herbidospora galbida]